MDANPTFRPQNLGAPDLKNYAKVDFLDAEQPERSARSTMTQIKAQKFPFTTEIDKLTEKNDSARDSPRSMLRLGDQNLRKSSTKSQTSSKPPKARTYSNSAANKRKSTSISNIVKVDRLFLDQADNIQEESPYMIKNLPKP